jgi:hypothetical protein
VIDNDNNSKQIKIKIILFLNKKIPEIPTIKKNKPRYKKSIITIVIFKKWNNLHKLMCKKLQDMKDK